MEGRAALLAGPAQQREGFPAPSFAGWGTWLPAATSISLPILYSTVSTRLDAGVQVHKMLAMSAATTNGAVFGRQVKRKFLPQVP